MITVTRYHDFAAGHRVVGHEGKCKMLHGHNYRVHFTCSAEKLDDLGRVIDFGVIKSKLCNWLEEEWDHKTLLWVHDPIIRELNDPDAIINETKNNIRDMLKRSVVKVPFNPTAENIAQHLLEVVGPEQLAGTGVMLTKVVVDETRKCSACAERS